jgi:hypothetical protein
MKEGETRLIRLARRFDGCRYRCKEALNRIIDDDDDDDDDDNDDEDVYRVTWTGTVHGYRFTFIT